jgi:hypothetical protein
MKSRYLLAGLLWFLIFLNCSVIVLSVALAPRKSNFTYITGDPLSYLFNTRELDEVPWIFLASLLLSLGIYLFVRGYLRAIGEDQRQDRKEGPSKEQEEITHGLERGSK